MGLSPRTKHLPAAGSSPQPGRTFCVSWTVLRSISMTWFCSPPTSSVLLSVSRRLCMSSDSSMLRERGRGQPSRSCPARGGSGEGGGSALALSHI